jgi:penicillin-binding protein 2
MARRSSTDSLSDSEIWRDGLVPGQAISGGQNSLSSQMSKRVMIVSALIIVAMFGLVSRLFFMQVVDAESYNALANGNRVRLEVSYAPRGKILDRKNNVIADNTLSFQLTATPYLMSADEAERQQDFEYVSSVTGQKPEEVTKTVSEKGLDFVQPILVAESLSHDQARKLETAGELAGFSIDEVPTRKYDSRAGLANMVGYTGRVSPDDLEANPDLLPADYVGKDGIEYQYDQVLRGKNGWQRIEVDALGRPVRVLAKQDPEPGQDLKLTIDRDLQIAMTNATMKEMAKAKVTKSAGAAVHPVTGEVLALVTVPFYDNNLFADGISQQEFSTLVNDPNQPLYNKAMSGGFSSGSTIKPLVASAALQEKVVDENTTINDVNALVLPGGFSFASWRPGGLGPMNVRRAIAWSSNIYFYTVGGGYGDIQGLGQPRLQDYYRKFGLGELSGIDIPGETAGRVPDEKFKQELTGEGWYVGDSYNIAIGQGDLLISPLQLAMAHSAIANNGYLMQPFVAEQAGKNVRRELPIDKNYLQIVREGMRQVLTDGTTCECVFKNVPVPVAGKSGTAETNTPDGKRPNAWFSAYAPYESPEILITLILEEGVGGSQFAAPAIAETMTQYFKGN